MESHSNSNTDLSVPTYCVCCSLPQDEHEYDVPFSSEVDSNENEECVSDGTRNEKENITNFNHSTPDVNTSVSNKLTDSLLEKIFNFLNFGDLMASRKVSHRWDNILTKSDIFLESTILNLTLEYQNIDMISKTKISWRQTKLQFFDFDSIRLEQPFNPTKTIFTYIVRLEFHHCFVTWISIKKYISLCPKLQKLIISRCIIQESVSDEIDKLTKLEDEGCTQTINSLIYVSIHDVHEIGAITRCLLKLMTYCCGNIETLKISYCPYVQILSTEDITNFFKTLVQFLQINSESLRNLNLDIRSNELLNRFCPFVLTPLCMSKRRLKLQVFKLTPPYPNCGNFGIFQESGRSIELFLEFLNSQHNLKSLGFPHFYNLNSNENRRIQILDNLDPSLEKLYVPGQIYLRRNFLKIFINLKFLFIGDKSGIGRGAMLNPTRFAFDIRGGVAKKTCKQFRHLSTYSKINYESGKLYHVIEKFPNLTSFEFDGLKPILNDRDLQAIIKFLPTLIHISLSNCDFISDFGVTGIPIHTCSNMNKLSTIYTESENIVNEQFRTNGKSISSLKGLKKLHLIGQSKLTDVGLSLGFRFLELKSLHLPWNERITDWGIEQIGKNNPSLEIINMTAAMASTSLLGFTQLIQTHPRIRRRHCRVHTIHMFQEDSIANPSLLTAVLWDDISLIE